MFSKKMFMGIALMAILAALFVGCATVSAEDAYVTLDINPSVDLIVNGDDKVLVATPLNEDGELLLLGLDLVGENLDDAIATIIDQSINLGFIDIEATETLVSVAAVGRTAELGETIRERVMQHVDDAFRERGMMGRAVERASDLSTVAAAGALGVDPAQYNLAKKACELDDTLTIETAAAMEPAQLMERIRTKAQEGKDVAQALKDEFLAARQALQDTYLPQIQALEDAIAAAEEGVDTAMLESELAALRDAFAAELAALRETYHATSEERKATLRTEIQNRIDEHAAAVAAWRNEVQTRRAELEDDIDLYQHRTTTEAETAEAGLTTTEDGTGGNTATSGTGGAN